MSPTWITILGLAAGTLGVRLGGYLLGRSLPQHGAWARGLDAVPGCLITALLATQLANGGPAEWGAGAASLVTAIFTRSLPLTMIVGLVAIAGLRAL